MGEIENKKILIVEDSPALAKAIEKGLTKEGYQVFVVRNGFEALRDVDQIKPDLIMTDVNMPKLDGIKMCQAIQNRLETRDIPFILVSSQLDAKTLQTGKAIGARYFIAKPFKMEQILSRVREVLG